MADAPIALDSRCEQAAERELEEGLSVEDAAELAVLVLVSGFVRWKEWPTQNVMGVWSGHWNELLHGLSFATEGSFAGVMKGMLARLLRLDKSFFPLLQSCVLYCQQVPSLQRAMPVVDALSPFMQKPLCGMTARNTDDTAFVPTNFEEESDCLCLLQQCTDTKVSLSSGWAR